MLTVLIVDDEYYSRLSLKTTIDWEKYGFCIIAEAENGEEGYEKFIEYIPDIIITDIKMGHSNGLDMIKKIHNESPDTQIIVLSGFDEFDYAKIAYENGVFSYMIKPITNDELLNKLLSISTIIKEKRIKELSDDLLNKKILKLKKEFLNAFFTQNTLSSKVIHENAILYDISFPEKYFAVITISVTEYEIEPDEKNNVFNSISIILSNMKNDYVFTVIDNNNVVLVF